jgi:two-component system alkaline phosphatase synthesis response regulator PhoP
MSKSKIMVIDDDTKSLELMEAILIPKGHEVITISDSLQAVALIIVNKPDLILLDVMMPMLDGYSLLSEIKKNNTISKIPVVMLTALGFELNKELAHNLGAVGYLTKPVDSAELIQIVSHLLPVI